MSEIMSTQQRDLEIALYYTDYDMDNAKAMVLGEYKDQYALKGVFYSATLRGAFLIFFNVFRQSSSNIYFALSSASSIDTLDPETPWQDFESTLVEIYNSEKSDPIQTSQILNLLLPSMNFEFNKEIRKYLGSEDVTMVNFRFKKLLEDKLGIQQVQLTLALEALSSLDMELMSISSEKLDLDSIKKKRSAGESKLSEIIDFTRKIDDPLEGQDVQLLLNGSLVLSPIKGKNVTDLVEGDEVKVTISEKSQRAVEIGRVFNVYDDKTGTFAPIRGRVFINTRNKNDNEIYVSIAKGIFVKAVEEENVKIAVVVSYGQEKNEDVKKKKDGSILLGKSDEKNNPLIIGICCGVLLLLILFFLYLW